MPSSNSYKLLLCFIAVVMLIQCHVQKKAQYELPEAMLPHIKVAYTARCDKGKILYDLNCGSCHTKKVKRKEIIPDFTPFQLINYELRIKNIEHRKNLSGASVTEEELGDIIVFLTYKKKNPVAPVVKK